MCVSIYVCAFMCVFYVHICQCVYVRVYSYLCKYVYMPMSLCPCLSMSMCVCVLYVFMCMSKCASTYTYVRGLYLCVECFLCVSLGYLFIYIYLLSFQFRKVSQRSCLPVSSRDFPSWLGQQCDPGRGESV